jgi:shikimate dehydrogenase
MRLLGVIGHPVDHSRSPAMQNAALEQLGLGEQWRYEAIDVAPEALADFLETMDDEGFIGVNVTVPHKEAALELAGEATERAKAIGAANTLTVDGDKILAENTDAPGLMAALSSSVDGRHALVLGAGGAARAAIWALADAGADVSVWNRTPARAAKIAAAFGVETIEAKGLLPAGEFDLIINATTIGMDDRGGISELRLDPAALTPDHAIVDMAYGDRETELVAVAREAGATVVDGLEVLVRQGAESLRVWTRREAPLDVMRRAVR